MTKKLTITAIAFCLAISIFAQQKPLYDSSANATEDIEAAVKKAAAEHKFVLIQAGGNWCSWCREFARFCKADPTIDSLLNKSFVWYHLNYSKGHENKPTFAKYGNPERFGFPVFILLDGKGERLNTQASYYLEDGKKSYDREKVLDFLNQWTPEAVNPAPAK